jgi:hypothetical protein
VFTAWYGLGLYIGPFHHERVISSSVICTVCPNLYRNRHFFNNSNTTEDIAAKFEQQYVLFFHMSYSMK